MEQLLGSITYLFPDPIGHFRAPWCPFQILQVVLRYRPLVSAPFAVRLVLMTSSFFAFFHIYFFYNLQLVFIFSSFFINSEQRAYIILEWSFIVLSRKVMIISVFTIFRFRKPYCSFTKHAEYYTGTKRTHCSAKV